jgi:hypothetical protein
LLVRMLLVSETDKEWNGRFEKLLDWYEQVLSGSPCGRKKMINWTVFRKCK